MCLIDDRQDIVCALDRERDESCILNDEYMILRIRDDCSLVLRHLDHRETEKLDDCVRDWMKMIIRSMNVGNEPETTRTSFSATP